MHRPIHLEEPETTIISAAHRGVGEPALASGNIQRSLFEFVWPHFTNDGSRLLAGVALGWRTNDWFRRDTQRVSDKDRRLR